MGEMWFVAKEFDKRRLFFLARKVSLTFEVAGDLSKKTPPARPTNAVGGRKGRANIVWYN